MHGHLEHTTWMYFSLARRSDNNKRIESCIMIQTHLTRENKSRSIDSIKCPALRQEPRRHRLWWIQETRNYENGVSWQIDWWIQMDEMRHSLLRYVINW